MNPTAKEELVRNVVRFEDLTKGHHDFGELVSVKSGIWTPLQDLQEVLFEQTI